MLIAEMLLLLAVNDKGHVPVGSDAFVEVGLTGALLAELAIDGQLNIAEDATVRTRRAVKRRIARATAETPLAPQVAEIVDEMIAAVAATASAIAAG